MHGARNVPAVELVVLPHIQYAAVADVARAEQRYPGRVSVPRSHAAAQFPGWYVVPDLQRLPDNLTDVLARTANDHVRRPRVQQPAEPGDELGPEVDRQSAWDVPGGEVRHRPHVDHHSTELDELGHARRIQSRDERVPDDRRPAAVLFREAQEVRREATQSGQEPIDERVLVGCGQQRVGRLLLPDGGRPVATAWSGA